ncbi:hypothetical protein ACFE04_015270 [Oxalis oulophora]
MSSTNLSRRITALAAGEAHTVALTGDGGVYTWGRGMFGRLGTGSESDELFPVPVKFDSSKRLKFVAVAAGSYHTLAIADDGSVWSWGYNICILQQLNFFFWLFVHCLEIVTNTESPVCSVKAGGMMSMAIDNLGTLWMWGNFPLPSGSNESHTFSLFRSSTPSPVWDFNGRVVVKVACGNEHVIALVSSGETYEADDDLVCYSWGNNSHGQLGLGDREPRFSPEIIETFNEHSPWAVYEIACGAFHTALLTRKKRSSDILESTCFTFGLGENGQLGQGTTRDILSPKPVKELPEPLYLVSVDCGLFHTSLVSSAGNVWSWGMEKGLGLCPEASYSGNDAGDALIPRPIAKFEDPVQITCGAAHTVVVVNDGYKLWSWGRGRSGVLGNGKVVDFFVPTIVLWPPLNEDFKQDELNTVDEKGRAPENTIENEKKLSMAVEEMKLIESKLSIMRRYASILHGSIFGEAFDERNIPESLKQSDNFDIAKEWENMLESAERKKLIRLEMFYRNMLSGVKDKLLKKRIKEIINECLPSN